MISIFIPVSFAGEQPKFMESFGEYYCYAEGETLYISKDGLYYTAESFPEQVKNAAYINGKLADFKKSEIFRRMSYDTQTVMMEINIADDYFKAKKLADDLEADSDAKDKEIYDLKHELISSQIKLDAANQEIEQLRARNNENQKTIVKLETEIDNLK